MTTEQSDKRIAFLVAEEGIEEVELTSPWQAVKDAGFTPVLLSPDGGTVQAYEHLDKAGTYDVDEVVGEADVRDFVGLVLPGGVANPDALRQDTDAVEFVADMVASGRTVAAICHAPWMLVEASAVSGRRVTSWPSLRTDLENAGAKWLDEQVVVDANLITSRKPDDLDAFNGALLDALTRREPAGR